MNGILGRFIFVYVKCLIYDLDECLCKYLVYLVFIYLVSGKDLFVIKFLDKLLVYINL